MRKENKATPEFIRIADICDILHISRSTASRLCKTQDFPYIKLGKSYRINKEKFYEWLSTKMGGSVELPSKPTSGESEETDD